MKGKIGPIIRTQIFIRISYGQRVGELFKKNRPNTNVEVWLSFASAAASIAARRTKA